MAVHKTFKFPDFASRFLYFVLLIFTTSHSKTHTPIESYSTIIATNVVGVTVKRRDSANAKEEDRLCPRQNESASGISQQRAIIFIR